MRAMERARPRFFYSLHNAGFCGAYFYASHRAPALFHAFAALVASQGLPLHRGEPEVPYLRTLAPGVYAQFGVAETYEYLARTLGGDPAPHIDAGTSSDDWLARVCDAFSLVCELPYYTAPGLADTAPAGVSRREGLRAGLAREEALLAECAAAFAAIAARAPDHRLTRSVADYLRRSPARLAADRAEIEQPVYGREATRAEALDAAVCKPFYRLLYLGEVFRLAGMVGETALAATLRARIETLAAEMARESELSVLPLRPLVAAQAGAGLLALSALADGDLDATPA